MLQRLMVLKNHSGEDTTIHSEISVSSDSFSTCARRPFAQFNSDSTVKGTYVCRCLYILGVLDLSCYILNNSWKL